MAGSSVAITRRKIGDIVEIKFVWVSDNATGAVTSASAGNVTSFHVIGKLMRFTTIPAAAGSAPTDNYDITVVTQNGSDILNGLGTDRDTANTEHKLDMDGLFTFLADSLTLTVANAGNSKGGTVYLYVADLSGDPL